MAAQNPSTSRDGVIWYDGKLVPWREATLHVLTHGLHYASCRVRGRARLWRSNLQDAPSIPSGSSDRRNMLDFEIPYSVAEIDAAKRLVLEKNGQADAMCARSPGAARR